MTLYILNYNNYYNRRLKREDTLEAYLEFEHYSLMSVNFNPNDGVDTSHIMGTGDYDGRGDYLLVVNERGQIQSRWFIIEAVRNRAGQYQVILHRDLIADYYSETISAPAFIEKAIVPNSNPLIYNSERMSFNQIKKGELLIKDKSQCPWIVGYYAKNTPTTSLSGTIAAGPDNLYDIQIDTTFEDWKYNATEKEFRTTQKLVYIGISANQQGSTGGSFFVVSYLFNGDGSYAGSSLGNTTETLKIKKTAINALEKELAASSSDLWQAIKTGYLDGATDLETDYFLNLNGKKIRDINGEIYSILVQPQSLERKGIDIKAGSAFNILAKVITDVKNNYQHINAVYFSTVYIDKYGK